MLLVTYRLWSEPNPVVSKPGSFLRGPGKTCSVILYCESRFLLANGGMAFCLGHCRDCFSRCLGTEAGIIEDTCDPASDWVAGTSWDRLDPYATEYLGACFAQSQSGAVRAEIPVTLLFHML